MTKENKTIRDYEQMTLAQLRDEAKTLKMEDYMEFQKRELILEILKKSNQNWQR